MKELETGYEIPFGKQLRVQEIELSEPASWKFLLKF